LLLKSIGCCFLLLQILFNFLAMREVVSNTRVNVAETETRKALDNLLGCRSQFEMMNNGVQTNSRAFDANSPMLGNNKRHADGFFEGHHNGFDYT
jgi:hypothetical protein